MYLRFVATLCFAALLAAAAPALCQEGAVAATELAPAPEPDGAAIDAEMAQILTDMGAPPEARMMLPLLLDENVNPMVAMMLMAMVQDQGMGGGMGQALGMMMFSGQARGGQGAAPVATLEGNTLFIIENGTLYKVNATTMALEGQVAYRGNSKLALLKMLRAIAPMMEQAGGQARDAALEGHLRTLQNAVDLYHNDTGDWPATVEDLTVAEDAGPDGYHGPYLREVPQNPNGGGWLIDADGVVMAAPGW
jgi:hypothetical protein